MRGLMPTVNPRGLVIFLTGLPGAGKSTLAQALAALIERTGRAVTLLDGDEVRRLLSSELGFSRAHRDLNVQRIGYVATARMCAIAPGRRGASSLFMSLLRSRSASGAIRSISMRERGRDCCLDSPV